MNISAKIIQQSIHCTTGTIIITYELEYPRYIHAELMTHRMFSRNSASSRAIPVSAMHDQIRAANVEFVHYGKNQPGMQAKEQLDSDTTSKVRELWFGLREQVLGVTKQMSDLGLHKQAANRACEPWMMMKVVLTTTEDANWFWLREHEDAQPEIHVLATKMREAKELYNDTICLYPGEWHVPYVHRNHNGEFMEYWVGDTRVSLEVARKVSASCCAQVSYRKNDDSIEKAEAIFDRLILSEPIHASPIEHQATPIMYKGEYDPETWPKGVTHITANGDLWSGNFRDFVQFRQTIDNNAKW
jgi:thymidylate synthase ThyX